MYTLKYFSSHAAPINDSDAERLKDETKEESHMQEKNLTHRTVKASANMRKLQKKKKQANTKWKMNEWSLFAN